LFDKIHEAREIIFETHEFRKIEFETHEKKLTLAIAWDSKESMLFWILRISFHWKKKIIALSCLEKMLGIKRYLSCGPPMFLIWMLLTFSISFIE